VRFFTQTDEVFDGDEPACQSEDDIDRDKASELQPGKGRSINTEPQRLTGDDVRLSGLFVGEASVQEIHDGEDCPSERHEGKHEESPTGPDVGVGLSDQKIQAAPADDDKDESGDAEWSEGRLRSVH